MGEQEQVPDLRRGIELTYFILVFSSSFDYAYYIFYVKDFVIIIQITMDYVSFYSGGSRRQGPGSITQYNTVTGNKIKLDNVKQCKTDLYPC